ncbi:hypothetical protein [Sphingobacterium faecium]|uniref:hypothetical protein n=1 Tax=Sphingobacterium faecium TaxID=34087 RepID=UPI002468F7B5|nr:hypothetical protein [Sphingobacterium faecium]MDH5826821.1 hypothetical protein [Sphingobacterium faecium]
MLLKIMRIEQGNNSTLSEIYLQQTALMAAVGTVVSYSTSSCLGKWNRRRK